MLKADNKDAHGHSWTRTDEGPEVGASCAPEFQVGAAGEVPGQEPDDARME